MNLDLIRNIYNLHIRALQKLDYNIISKDNYQIVYNTNIKDVYSNFISNFDVNDKEQFDNIIDNTCIEFKNIGRKTALYLIPHMKNLYKNRENFFDNDNFELVSTEVWQLYTDFDKLDNIKTHCKFDVALEATTDMKSYADMLMKGYQSGDALDPYGDLDDGYRQSYINYKKIHNDIGIEFYFIKVNNEIIGTVESVYNVELYGIYGLALKKEYRGKGIGKEVLKKQLEMCRNKNIKVAYLQTEQDFYPAKMYRKLGFKDLCEVYYYLKK